MGLILDDEALSQLLIGVVQIISSGRIAKPLSRLEILRKNED